MSRIDSVRLLLFNCLLFVVLMAYSLHGHCPTNFRNVVFVKKQLYDLDPENRQQLRKLRIKNIMQMLTYECRQRYFCIIYIM